MDHWEWLTLLSRWSLYLSMALAVGGVASEWLLYPYRPLKSALRRYALTGILLASFALVLHFLVRIGALAEAGIGGMVDSLMFQVLWQSTVGDSLMWAGTGLLLLAGSHCIGARAGNAGLMHWLQILIAIIGMGVLAFSYTLSGHVHSSGVLAAIALTIHVSIVSWWLGALFPLWLATHRLGLKQSHRVLDLFGRLALPAVLLLLGAGVLLSYQLTGWREGLLDSRYGFWLVLKVALVGVILVLAAFHRFYLVPTLQRAGNARAMKGSLLLEKAVGMAILAVTTVLAVLVGPAH